MVDRLPILIVEDDDILAMNLAAAIDDRDCDVVGPVATVVEALAMLASTVTGGAVLDASLLDGDVTPVAMELIDRGIPFVIYTGVGLPAELATVFPHVSVIMKPTDPDEVVARLLAQVRALSGSISRMDRVESDAPAAGPDRAMQIDKVASALFAQFGAKAIVLARRQATDASGETARSWRAIIDNLAARTPS